MLAALDEALRLEALQHLARRGAGDAEHVRDAHGEGGRALRVRAVFPDGKSQEIDRLEVVVDRVSRRHLRDDPTGAPLRLGLPAGDRARSRAAVHLPRRRPREGVGRLRSVRTGAPPRGRRRARGRGSAGGRARCRRAHSRLGLAARSSTSHSGSPTTTARRRRALSRSSRRRRGRDATAPSAARARRRSPAEAAPETLTEEQEAALARIVGALGTGGSFLLYGATGSGKTEVYLRACEEALARGLGAIVLVPEIALTPQALGRFTARFAGRVAVLHSGMTDAERRDERERIASGEARVVVGARSAVFAPVEQTRPDLRRRGARRLLQAGVRPPLRRAHRRGEARRAGEARSSSTEARRRDPRAGSGSSDSSWAGASARRLPHVQVVDLRREAGYPLSAPLLDELGADLGRRAARRSSS